MNRSQAGADLTLCGLPLSILVRCGTEVGFQCNQCVVTAKLANLPRRGDEKHTYYRSSVPRNPHPSVNRRVAGLQMIWVSRFGDTRQLTPTAPSGWN